MRLLFLAHRVPFPPNKGDKIRTYNELRFLAARHEVDLVCLADRQEDLAHEAKLREFCHSVHIFPLAAPARYRSAARAFFKGGSMSVAMFHSPKAKAKVEDLIGSRNYDAVFAFSSQMAQYLEGHAEKAILDFCDVDSEKWRHYARSKARHMRWLYRMEADRLLRFEKYHSARARATLFVTPAEAGIFRSLGGQGNIGAVKNGVDLDYFHPMSTPLEKNRVLFTGAMDYFPNEDAVSWYAKEVHAPLSRRIPGLQFVIAGSNPTPTVKRLEDIEGVRVTGFVDDMRTQIALAHVVVVPLRIARGLQNKVLEGMACAKPLVITPHAREGIDAEPGRHLHVAKDAFGFQTRVEELLTSDAQAEAMGRAAREFIEQHFRWDRNLEEGLEKVLRG